MSSFNCDLKGKEKIRININDSNFKEYKKRSPKSKIDEYLIIGFDTEYQTRSDQEGLDNELLSYQYSCSIIKSDKSECVRWSNIILPKSEKVEGRLSLKEFVEVSISDGIKRNKGLKVPRDIYLVSHFSRVDVPGFIDFKNDKLGREKLNLSNIRNSFVSLKKDVDVSLGKENDIKVNIKIRDTLHLSPQNAKSLQDLGDVLGFEKIKLANTDKESKKIKSNMKDLMLSDWELFKDYAIRDSDICTKYCEDMINLYHDLTNKFLLPITLTSIGVDLLMKFWRDKGLDELEVIGKERISEKIFVPKLGHYIKKNQKPYKQKVNWSIDFVTETYHGGRNEQYYFGSSDKDVWYDYDLQSCYPSCMSLIGIPDWNGIKNITKLSELLSYKVTDLAFANVEFEFDESVRFPCLPVRTDNGLIFPRSGNSSTHISEIKLAVSLGCKLKFIEGRFIPSNRDGRNEKGYRNRLFEDFLKDCIDKRSQFKKKSLMNLFWKEIANSTYGKLAQGLRKRRIYNLDDDEMKELEESKITNPFFASFVTSFARGTLSEIMNNLPRNKIIFSVTTDGFLTNANSEDLKNSVGGVLSKYYKSARTKLVGDDEVYEIKHITQQLIGWRTRGQGTLIEGTQKLFPNSKREERIVLAKGGIKLVDVYEKGEQNEEIIEHFFNREPESHIPFVIGLGIKDMYRGGIDFIDKKIMKRLSMEFDWKRKPSKIGMKDIKTLKNNSHSHLRFETEPWENSDQFFKIRYLWDEYNKGKRHCLKTIEDYEQFAEYVESMLSLDNISQKYLKKENGDIDRLRRDLITSWRYRKSGTHLFKNKCFGYENVFPSYKMTHSQFAEILNDKLLIPCNKDHVDNGCKIKTFIPNQVPNTEIVREKLRFIKSTLFPHLKIDEFLAKRSNWDIRCDVKI